MTGGTVIEIAESRKQPDRVFVDIQENNWRFSTGLWLRKTEQSLAIEFGDFIWFDSSRTAYWTPAKSFDKVTHKAGIEFDIPLRRIGFSGVVYAERVHK